MNKIYNAIEIAKYMINKCMHENCPISNLQLQIMLYFLQGESYKLREQPLFTNRIEAWPYIPVVPDVYYLYSASWAVPIYMFYENADANIDLQDQQWINPLIERYSNMDVWDLIDLSHTDGAPWYNTIKLKGGGIIEERIIKSYYPLKLGAIQP